MFVGSIAAPAVMYFVFWRPIFPNVNPPPIFVAFLALILVVNLTQATYGWIRNFATTQSVSLSRDSIRINTRSGPFTQHRAYGASEVSRLRVIPMAPSGASPKWRLGKSAEALAFDYGNQTVTFGLNLDEAEAKQILNAISARYPALAGEKR